MIEVKYGPEIQDVSNFIGELSKLKKVTFVTTSNRSPFVEKKYGESPKSTQLAHHLADILKRKGIKVSVLDAAKLKIYNSLGCVSEIKGNLCGVKKSLVKDKEKNPHGHLRCWASHDFEDDELWRITNEMFESQAIIFFGSQRWGNVNAVYQKLIERLDWLESRWTTLGEENIIANIKAGLVLLGQNWRVRETLEVQREVLKFYGFSISDPLFLGWQYTRDSADESDSSYINSAPTFEKSWNMELTKDDKIEKFDLSESKEIKDSDFPTFLEFISKNI
jgi:multimeric flavodoxin WrbA